MPKFFIAAEVFDYEFGHADEVDAPDMDKAAEREAARVFDEEGVDWLRPVEVLVAETRKGRGCRRYSIRRVVDHVIEDSDDVWIDGSDA